MLLSAAPLLHTPRLKLLRRTVTGCPWYCDSARTAPPPRSGPVASQRLRTKVDPTIFSRPPRANIAPPPPPSYVEPVALPSAKRQVLHHETRRGLVVTVRRGPDLPPVAGVLIEDPALPAAAERDQAAAVEDDPTAGVDHLGGLSHLDPHRRRPAAEPDDPALCDRPYHRAGRAAPRRAGPDPTVWARAVYRLRRVGHVDRGRCGRQWPDERQTNRCENDGKRGAQFA